MLIIDRIENGFAVCEKQDKSFVDLDVNLIKSDFKQGDVLIEQNGVWIKDENLTKQRKEFAINLQKKLFGE